MGKYSEVLPYEEILGLVKGRYNNILIIGCGSCMNESLAIKNNVSVFENENHYPPIENECNSLKEFLCDQRIEASCRILKSGSNMGCIRNAKGETNGIGEINGIEAILMISCADGVWGIGEYLRGREIYIPVYCISRWKGFYYICYKNDEEKMNKEIINCDVKYFC